MGRYDSAMLAQNFLSRHQHDWHLSWQALAPQPPEKDLLANLCERYSEAHRQYHTLQHLDACLRHLSALRGLATRPHEVALALWFHDAIYHLGAADNERRSAEWASHALLSASAEATVVRRVFALSMVTRHEHAPASVDEQVMLDVDLAILGARDSVFDGYEGQVRAEYHAVPEPLFRVNRRRILQGFLLRKRIYHTDMFHGRFEAQAQRNLARSIAALQD